LKQTHPLRRQGHHLAPKHHSSVRIEHKNCVAHLTMRSQNSGLNQLGKRSIRSDRGDTDIWRGTKDHREVEDS
jgi:hypothetical protein